MASTDEVAVTCADLVPADNDPAICSEQATDLVSLSINNDCQEVAVDVYWVGSLCAEDLYARIEPNGGLDSPELSDPSMADSERGHRGADPGDPGVGRRHHVRRFAAVTPLGTVVTLARRCPGPR